MQEEAGAAKVVFQKSEDGSAVNLEFSGDWLLRGPRPDIQEVLSGFSELETGGKLRLTFSKLGEWDTGLMIYLQECYTEASERGLQIEEKGVPNGIAKLLQLTRAVPEKDTGSKIDSRNTIQRLAADAHEIFSGMCEFLSFAGEVVLGFTRMFRGKKVFRWVDFAQVLYQCSCGALPIVSLISLLTGLTMAFVGAVQLQKFGAGIYVADLVGLAMVREMGALMTAIVMTGRTGASFAAHLGNMKVSEEIDAFRTMGIQPVDFLVLPRLIALVVLMPLLSMYANLIGIFGGYLVGVLMLDMSPTQYVQQTINAMKLMDVWTGEIKSFFFGMVVAASGCFYGIMCGQSSAAVGQAVTRSVVSGITFIIVVDAIFAVVFHILGI